MFPIHAYERGEDKKGRGAGVAIPGLMKGLDDKQKVINDMKAMVEQEDEGRRKMLKEMTGASNKVLAETRSSFESINDIKQLRIICMLLREKKVNEVRYLSKKSLVDLLMKIPPPSTEQLKNRLLQAGLKADGNRKQLLKRAVEAGLISAEEAGVAPPPAAG